MIAEQELSSLELKENEDIAAVSEIESHRSGKSKISVTSSRRNGQLTPIKTGSSTQIKKEENPFKIRDNEDLFEFRDNERKRKQEERDKQKDLKIYEKSYGVDNRLKIRQVALLKDSDDEQDNMTHDQSLVVKEDPEFVISATKGRNIEKETLSEYITKKREMFLVQYSLGVKKEEMRKLEEISAAEEKKLELAEQCLEEDAIMFDEFLNENDKSAADAMKNAEIESKERMELVSQVKSLNTQLMQIKSELNKYEEQLEEYKTYKKFLDRLLPEKIREQKEERAKEKKEAKEREKIRKAAEAEAEAKPKEKSSVSLRRSSVSRRKSVSDSVTSKNTSRSEKSNIPQIEDYSSDDSDMELYFKDPQELLKIFTELEESNLSLIQTCQETEESLDELKQRKENMELKMKKDTDSLMYQITKLETAIAEEEEKIQDLEEKKCIFQNLKDKDPDEFLSDLYSKVLEVYKNTVSKTETSMSTLEMLQCIEGELERLFKKIEEIPIEKREIAQKKKDKERRKQMRKEMAEKQQQAAEESKRKALERAKAPPKKQTGRRIIERSEPPQKQKEDPKLSDQRNKEEEELKYFFT